MQELSSSLGCTSVYDLAQYARSVGIGLIGAAVLTGGVTTSLEVSFLVSAVASRALLVKVARLEGLNSALFKVTRSILPLVFFAVIAATAAFFGTPPLQAFGVARTAAVIGNIAIRIRGFNSKSHDVKGLQKELAILAFGLNFGVLGASGLSTFREGLIGGMALQGGGLILQRLTGLIEIL